MRLARFNFAVQDDEGNVVDGATLTLTKEFTVAPGIAFSDIGGTVSLGSSWIAADGADAGFHAAGGWYRIDAVKGAFSRTWRYQMIGTAQAQDADVAGGTDGIRMVFDDATSAADPGSGFFRGNSLTFASITALYIDNEAYGSASITAWLDSLDDGGTSVHRGILRVEHSTDPLTWAEFNVSGSVVDSTGYRTITVTPRASAGFPFEAGDFFSLSSNRTGISGANGVNGTSALTVIRCVSTANVNVANGLEQGDTVDGVSVTAGDLVLLAGQTAPAENGIYVAVGAGAGAASRHASFDTYDECPGACFSVLEGTSNGRAIWQCTSVPGGTINVTALNFVRRAGPLTPGMINGTLVESHSGNAVTFAVKTLAGADPSPADPVQFVFQNGAGAYVMRCATSALAITISSGSTLGVANATAFRVWITAIDNAGTVELAAVNCRSGNDILALDDWAPYSSTTEGGAGAADSAQVLYSATGRTSKYICIVGFADYGDQGAGAYGLVTAGTWVVSPTSLVLFNQSVPRPGQVIRSKQVTLDTVFTSATAGAWTDITGMSGAITLRSPCNLVRSEYNLGATQTSGNYLHFRMRRGSTSIGVGQAATSREQVTTSTNRTTSAVSIPPNSAVVYDFPGATGAQTYKVQFFLQGGTAYINEASDDTNSAGYPRSASMLTLTEIMG